MSGEPMAWVLPGESALRVRGREISLEAGKPEAKLLEGLGWRVAADA